MTTTERAWSSVRARLGSLRVGPPRSCGALSLVPLLGPDLPADLDLLEEATRFRLDEIGRVDRLLATNGGPRPVLLLDGEALSGGMQNRMLRAQTLVGAREQVELPVCCVERARWSPGGKLTSSRSLAPPSVRSGRSQPEVWRQVEGHLTRTRAASATRSMQTAMASVRPVANPVARGQVGLVALLGERLLCLEALCSAALYARAHPKLMASLALEGHGLRPRMLRFSRRDRAEELLERVRALPGGAPGLGQELRFATAGLAGQALVWHDLVVCLSALGQ